MTTEEKQARLKVLRQLILHKESAVKYLGTCIFNRSSKGDSCIDLIDDHSARQRELSALEAEWTLLTGKVEELTFL